MLARNDVHCIKFSCQYGCQKQLAGNTVINAFTLLPWSLQEHCYHHWQTK